MLSLIKGLGRGGAERLLVSAVRYADRSRFAHEVAYLLPWKDAFVRELEDEGIPVHCLGATRGPAWVPRLRNLVREGGFDVVHGHSPYPMAVARLVLPDRHHLVYTEHNVWSRYHRATYWANLATYPRNDHVFAVSDEVRRSVSYPSALRFRPMPLIETLYHGPDPSAFEAPANPDGVRQELGIPERAPLVGTVANLKPHKGIPYLLRAVQDVQRDVPEVRFVIVGRGPSEQELRRLAHELGLDGIVVFTGYREDALRLASAFDLFVLSSLHEGLSIALVEAMALGKAVVVTRVGGLPEVVADGENGLLVPPADSGALAEGIVGLLRDDRRRSRLGEAAARRAADFDIRRAVRRMEEVYEGLTA